jgi:hypothetical protein
MQECQAAEALPRVMELLQFGAGPGEESPEGGVDGLHQQLFLVLEIQVDGAVGDAGTGGDVGHPRTGVAVLRDDLDGGIEDALILSALPGGGSRTNRGVPFWHWRLSPATPA